MASFFLGVGREKGQICQDSEGERAPAPSTLVASSLGLQQQVGHTIVTVTAKATEGAHFSSCLILVR